MQAAQHHHHLLGRSVPLSLYSRDARQWIHLTQAIDGVGGVHAESAAATGQHASSTSRASVPKEGHTILTLLTYNVFSGSSTPSNSHPGKRRTAALRVIQRAQPDVIALQEVSSEFERCLRRENWFRRDWITTSLADYFDVSTGGRSTSINARREDDGCLLALRRALLNRGDKDETREKMMTASAFMLRLDGDQGKVLVSVQGPSDVRWAERAELSQEQAIIDAVKSFFYRPCTRPAILRACPRASTSASGSTSERAVHWPSTRTRSFLEISTTLPTQNWHTF